MLKYYASKGGNKYSSYISKISTAEKDYVWYLFLFQKFFLYVKYMKYLIKDKLRQPSSKSILHKDYH